MKNRAKRRAETRRQQREAKVKFHPRGLARAVAHSRMAFAGMERVNKVQPGTTQSAFSQRWRNIAETMAER